MNLPIAEVIHQSITSGTVATDQERRPTTSSGWYLLTRWGRARSRPSASLARFSDTAGNRLGAGPGASSSRRADDLTRPEFAVSISGSAADRVAATGRTTDAVGIRVTATETLQATPDLYLVSFGYREAAAAVEDDPATDTP